MNVNWAQFVNSHVPLDTNLRMDMQIQNATVMVNGPPLIFLDGTFFHFDILLFTPDFSLYRVVFTRKVSNTIKDRLPKLGKYFKPWNNISNGTLNPSEITVSPKSADEDTEKYDEFLMNGKFKYFKVQSLKIYFQIFSKMLDAKPIIAVVQQSSSKN